MIVSHNRRPNIPLAGVPAPDLADMEPDFAKAVVVRASDAVEETGVTLSKRLPASVTLVEGSREMPRPQTASRRARSPACTRATDTKLKLGGSSITA